MTAADGFVISRRKGDYIVMTKPAVLRPVVIKISSPQVPVTHIRTNLTTAGISRERYFELLEQPNSAVIRILFTLIVRHIDRCRNGTRVSSQISCYSRNGIYAA